MRLRTKLTFVTVIIVVLSIFLSTFFIVFFAKQNTENTILVTAIKDFTAFYYKLSKSQVYFDSEQNSTSSRSFLRYIIMSIPGAEEFVLQQGDTTISNNTGIDAIGILNSNKNSSMSLNDTEIPIRYLFCNVKGVSYFLAVTTITIAHKTYSLSLVRNITVAADSIDTLAVQCLFVGIAVVFVAASCVLLFVRHALKPMKELEIGALEIANGNYGTRIMVKGNDEIAIVAKQFNNMAVAISDKIDTLNSAAERQQSFVNGLSHELKTPIASIMARAETLLNREISDEDRARSLERIHHQCAWLERFSGKLTSLVVLQRDFSKKPESVARLFEFVREAVSDSLQSNGIEFRVSCHINTLYMDFDLMASALFNLIDNARKASNPGAVIRLYAHDNVIEVKDYGKGIPADEIAHITEPFYMVDRSRNKKYGGTGLGLAIVKRIIEVHGAQMKIISELGQGTTVMLIFAQKDIDK